MAKVREEDIIKGEVGMIFFKDGRSDCEPKHEIDCRS
jgi:hypothetical protein